MSDAKTPITDIFSIAICSQCMQQFSPSATRDARHAVPCGHVFCRDCVRKVEAEQKSGNPVCRRVGCERPLAPVSEFGPSLITQRLERIRATHQHMFRDQGNVGDREAPTCSACAPDKDTGRAHLATHRCETCEGKVYVCAKVASLHPTLNATVGHVVVPLGTSAPSGFEAEGAPARVLCTQHKLPVQAFEASTNHSMCPECLVAVKDKVSVHTIDEAIAALETAHAATKAELLIQSSRLAEPIFNADQLRAQTAKWGAEETARIRAWEQREVKHVQAVADECVGLVQGVCARRIEVGASLITQRSGLRASLEEFDQVLADLPSDPVTRLSKKRAVYAERQQLCELLADNKIAFPSARAVLEWAELPALSAEFDQKAGNDGGVLPSVVAAEAKVTLGWARTHTPVMRDLPNVPKLDKAKGVRSIPTVNKSNVFVGLDDDTILVGCNEMARLQVWDLVSGKLVRKLGGFMGTKGQYCRSMINLLGGRIAVGWHTGSQYAVAVFDVNTGKQLQELTGFAGPIYALAWVEKQLLVMCADKTLRVYSQDSAGKFTEKAKFTTTDTPRGTMTVLSPSTVAMPMSNPTQIEIWDWKLGKCVRTLSGFGGDSVLGTALLPDNRFVAGDSTGIIRVGSLDDWAAATTLSSGSAINSVVAVKDGSFFAADSAGNIKLWREGACAVALTGGCTSPGYYGITLAIIGRRLVYIGNNSLLIAE